MRFAIDVPMHIGTVQRIKTMDKAGIDYAETHVRLDWLFYEGFVVVTGAEDLAVEEIT